MYQLPTNEEHGVWDTVYLPRPENDLTISLPAFPAPQSPVPAPLLPIQQGNQHEADAPAPRVQAERLPLSPPDRVFAAFNRSTSSRTPGWRSTFKRVIAWRQGGHRQHVELVFTWGMSTVLACTALREDGVTFKERDWDKRYLPQYWEVFELSMTPLEKQRLYEFCLRQNGKAFSYRGMYCNFLPCCLGRCCGTGDLPPELYEHNSSWFCSQLAAAALRYASQRYSDIPEPSTIHPESLYTILQNNSSLPITISTLYDPKNIHFSLH